MRHLKPFLRFFAVLFTLTLLSLLLPTQFDVTAQTERGSAVQKSKRKGPPDPCEKALKQAGNANRAASDDEDSDEEADDDDGRNRDRDDKEKDRRRCDSSGSGGAAKGDFNGDGFADLAVGAPREDEDLVGGVGAST